MNITDEMVEAAALSDAEFDGRNFVCMGRVDRDRYMLRAKAAITAALSLAPQVKETAPPSSHVRGMEAAIRTAGLKARDDLLERVADGGTVDNDLADYMTRIVDACVRAAIRSTEVVG